MEEIQLEARTSRKAEVDVSQEQQDQAQGQVPEEQQVRSDSSTSTIPSPTPGKKRRAKKAAPVSEEEITPRPSYWPFVLAFAIAVLLFGIVTHPIVLVLGVVFVILAATGWTLERR